MEKRIPRLFCINHHTASKLCAVETCSHPSVICSESSCKNCSFHKKYLATINVNQLFKLLFQDKQKIQQHRHQLLIQTIDKMIKDFRMLQIECVNNKKQLSQKTKQDSDRLLQLLTNGSTDQLKPILIFKYLQNYNSRSNQITQQKLTNQLRKTIENTLQLHSKILCQLEKSIRIQQPQESIFLFKKELCNKSQWKITNQGKTLTHNSIYANQQCHALISPSLNEAINTKLKLRFNKMKGQQKSKSLIGIIRRGVIKNGKLVNFNGDDIQYLVNSQGLIWNISDKTQHHKIFDFGFQEGDEVLLNFQMKAKTLTIDNLTTGQTCVVNNIVSQEESLWYCILTSGQQDTFEILN